MHLAKTIFIFFLLASTFAFASMLKIPFANAQPAGIVTVDNTQVDDGALLGIPRRKMVLDETNPERIWIFYYDWSPSDVMYTDNGGISWTQLTMYNVVQNHDSFDIDQYGNIHSAHREEDGSATYRRISAPATQNSDYVPANDERFNYFSSGDLTTASAVLANGNDVWVFTRQSSGSTDYYAGSTDRGITFTRNGILASGLYNTGSGNRIGAMVIDGITYAVIWEQTTPVNRIVFYYWTGSGFVRDNSMTLNLESNNALTRAYTFTQTDDGNVHVAYWDNSVGSRARHAYKKRTDASWTGPFTITSNCNTDCQIGITAHGNDVYAAYRGGASATLNYNKFTGGVWQGEHVIDSSVDITHPAFPKRVPATSDFIPLAWGKVGGDLYYYAIPATPAGNPIILNISNPQCEVNATTWTTCSNIHYNDRLTRVRANCNATNGTIARVNFSLLNVEDSTLFFSGSTSSVAGQTWTYDNADVIMQDSGNFQMNVICTDALGNSVSSQVGWLIPWGTLAAQQIDPLIDTTVINGTFFNYTTRVTCTGGECGPVIATLDPFNDTGWSTLYNETFDTPMTGVNGLTFGQDNWLIFQLFNGASITVNNGYAFLNTSDFQNAGLIRSTNTLPNEYKIRVKMGYINYDLSNYESTDYTDPLFNTHGGDYENGVYLVTITNDTCTGTQCAENWWHWHRKMVIDVDNHLASGVPVVHPLYMVYMDPQTNIQGNLLRTWRNGVWYTYSWNWEIAYTYALNTWYYAELEKKNNQIILRLYDQNQNLLQETTPVSLSLIFAMTQPDYFYIGEPHSDDYEGDARIDDIVLLVPNLQQKSVVPMNAGSPFYTTNINPASCAPMKAGDSCTTTWNVAADGPAASYAFFVMYNASYSGVTDIESSHRIITISSNACTLPYDYATCNCINATELNNAINAWYNDVISIPQLMQVIKQWTQGC